jgi:hypothetical protein
MYWVDNQNLKIGSTTILVLEYLQFIQDELDSLQEFLKDTVMFNIPTKDFFSMCNLKSLETTTGPPSLGDNPLFVKNSYFYGNNPSAFLINQDAIQLTTHIAKHQHLGLNPAVLPWDILAPTLKSSQVGWDHKKCHQWLSMVHIAWERAYCLYHTTSGLPARTTEEVTLRMTHSALGPTNLFIINGKLQTRSDYNKSSSTTGLNKHITRVFHARLAHIFLVLLRCVRPLELQVLKGVGAVDDSVDFIYTTMLFASWGKAWDSKGAAEVFSGWLSEGLHSKLTMGIAFYRQFATALQRQWLCETDVSIHSNFEQGTQSDDSQFEAVSEWWQAKLQLK